MPPPMPEDPRLKRVDDPALAVASKRIVALEADITNLRKGMVQQLTVSGKLLKSVFAIDTDYFGGRFQEQENKDNPDPFRDFTIATKIVEAVGEELQGASAFADSPVLRDGIANLVTALESSRAVAAEMEKAGIAAVGLPVKPESFKIRTFPENNPPGCLAEAAGSVHDLVSFMTRTRDRFSAMRMMMNEAERARSEAESSVIPVNVDKIAAAITAELTAVQSELKTTRAQLIATVDSHAQTTKQLRAELERARREANYETDSRKADRAEARSLAAEIARQVEQAMQPGDSDDLEITLSVLREALGEDQEISALAAATEGVVVDWIRLTSARVKKLSDELAKATAGRPASAATPAAPAPAQPAVDPAVAKAQAEQLTKLQDQLQAAEARARQAEAAAKEVEALKAKLDEAGKAGQQARADLDKARAEHAQQLAAKDAELKKLAEQQAQISQNRAATDRDLLTSRQQAVATGKELEDLRAQLAQRDAELKRVRDEAAAAAARVQEAQKAVETQGKLQQEQAKASDTAQRDVAALRAQVLQATTTLRLKEDEAKRAKETLQQEQAKHADALQNLTRQLNGQQEKLATTASELTAARGQATDLQRQFADLTQRHDAATKTAQAREAELRQAREAHARELKAAADGRAQADAALKQAEANRVSEAAELRKALAAAEARSVEAAARAEAAAAEAARLKAESARLAAENAKNTANLEFTAARERQLGSERERLERERSELQARLDALRKTSDANANQGEQTIGALKKQFTEAKAAESELRTQLTRLTAEVASIGDRNGQLEKDLAAVRVEREKVAGAVQSLTQERDQARAKLAELERERARLTEVAGKAESQARAVATELDQVQRAEREAIARAERLGAELAQLRDKLAAAQSGRDQLAAQQTALKGTEAQLAQDRDAARATIQATTAERDRLKAQVERLKADHDALAQRLEERESQLTARLTETSRQLGELKQVNIRLAAESERLQAEIARASAAGSAREDAKEAVERKESTAAWTKKLSETAASADQARARAAELERKVEELRHQLAHAEEKVARQGQGDVHLRERVAEIEKRETALQQALAAVKAETEQARARLAAAERELAAANARTKEQEESKLRLRQKFESLMREARDAVLAAKVRQEQTDADDREVIAGLMKQIQDLRLRTGTRA